jgi:hypothetical protein
MSTQKKNFMNSIKTINIKNKKILSNTISISTRSNDSTIIKINNQNNNNKTEQKTKIKLENRFSDNSRLCSANNYFIKSSKSFFTLEKQPLNKNNEILNYGASLNKQNKQNQVNFYYNDNLFNDRYRVTKVTNHYFKLKNVYNPHNNNFRIVKKKKNLIKEFMRQTKNNFNHNYKIKYFSPSVKNRNSVLQCFNSIKEKTRNIDDNNSIANIVNKEMNKNRNNKKTQIINNYSNQNNYKKHIFFPSELNFKLSISPKNRMQIKAMKMVDDISKNNMNYYNKRENICGYPFFMNKLNKQFENFFFKTVPPNKRINNNDNLLYSKTSIES